MDKPLRPFAKLDYDEYYMGEQWKEGGDSEEEMSSDDELKTQLKKLAGIRTECTKQVATTVRQRTRSEFEDDMEDELDRSMTDFTNIQIMGDPLPCVGDVQVTRIDDMDVEEAQPTSSNSGPVDKSTPIVKEVEAEAKIADEEEDENPIKQMANERKKAMKKELPEFYDADEDEENERWVQEHRTKVRGSKKQQKPDIDKKVQEARPGIDDGSDAVLSCPGCMSLLTRDCQRHELYQDQYRAMFVENCTVDIDDRLTIAKTGKDKRREKQKFKKLGIDPSNIEPSTEDVFQPVKCRVCGTKVAVMDHDEVYHFFNVLSGYA